MEPFEQYNPWISSFYPLLDLILYWGSAGNQHFFKEEGIIFYLSFEFLFFKMRNEKPWSIDYLDHFEQYFGLDYVFYS